MIAGRRPGARAGPASPPLPPSAAGLPDVPTAAYAKAVDAFGAFDRAAAAYASALETARALVADGRLDAAVSALGRGTTAMRAAVTAGRRIAPVRATLQAGAFAGSRADDLVRRITQGERRAAALAAAGETLAAECAGRRDDAARALQDTQPVPVRGGRAARASAAYGATGARPPLAVDLRR